MSFVSDITHKVVSGTKEKNIMISTKIDFIPTAERPYVVYVADDEKEMVGSSSFYSLKSAQKFAVACEMEICEMCGGTGEVGCMESVYPNEPHMAMVGSQKCECQLEEEFEE